MPTRLRLGRDSTRIINLPYRAAAMNVRAREVGSLFCAGTAGPIWAGRHRSTRTDVGKVPMSLVKF